MKNTNYWTLAMLEIAITLCILLFFIFPIPGLAVTLGLWTCYLIYRKLHLLKSQPPRWKMIVWIYMLTGAANLFFSMAMGLLLSLAVYFLIIDNMRLMVFNFLFCFLISSRWFDFTHAIYRYLVLKLETLSIPPPKEGVFVMVRGMRSGTGFGIGMTPISLDSGFLFWKGDRLVFEGVMTRRIFTRESILTVEKISSEKMNLFPVQRQTGDEKVAAWQIIFRQQFYPFKSRELRDQWCRRLSVAAEPSPAGWAIDGLESSQVPLA